MHDIVYPEPFSEFWGLWIFYISVWGFIVHSVATVFGWAMITVVSAVARQLRKMGERIARFTGFMLILLPVSGVFNALWNCLVWGNLYATYGPDTENDFTPFFPIDAGFLRMEDGQLLSGNIHQLEFVWLLFTALSWSIAFLFYRLGFHAIKNLISRPDPNVGDLEHNTPSNLANA